MFVIWKASSMLARVTGLPVSWWIVITAVALGVAYVVIRRSLDRRSK